LRGYFLKIELCVRARAAFTPTAQRVEPLGLCYLNKI